MIVFSFGGADRHFCPVKRLLKPFKHFLLFQHLKKRSKNLSANHLSRQFNADYNRKANSCGQHDQLIHPQPELWFGHLLRALSVQKQNKKKHQRSDAACWRNNCSGAASSDSSVYMYGAIRGIIISPHKEAV